MKKQLLQLPLRCIVLLLVLTGYTRFSQAQGTTCLASFTYTVDSSTNSVFFINTSTGNWLYSYWDFGDGNYSQQTHPIHFYSGSNSFYLVCLTVWDSLTCQSTTCDTVWIQSGGQSCFANFTYMISGMSVFFNPFISGTYSSLLWDFGDGTTSTNYNPTHVYTSPGLYTVCLTLYDSTGNICSQPCVTLTIQMQPADTVCGNIWIDANGNGVMDPGEAPVNGGQVFLYGNGTQQLATTNAQGYYQFLLNPGNYWIYYCHPAGYVFTVPTSNDSIGCAWYQFTVVAGQSQCGFDFGIQQGVEISGMLFHDANTNGIFNLGEAGIANQAVQIGSYTSFTSSNGSFSIIVPAGVYLVSYTPQGAFAAYSLTTPSGYTVTATVPGNTYGGNDFGLNIPPGSVNLSVNIIAGSTVTPGFPAYYYIYVLNVGALPTAATLTMNYNPGLSLNTSTPSFASHNPTTQTITWNLPVIPAQGSTSVFVKFDTPTTYVIGQLTLETVNVMPVSGTDIDLSNNIDTLHQIVTGSWDPNNKLSIQTNNNNPTQQIISSVNPDQSISYVINFQNTGTAPAVNVSIVDQLSPDLVASSFQLIAMSHNGIVNRQGSNVNFIFNNIMLPDSNTNEPGSHGFVAFKVNAVNGLPAGHVISDNAAIYFDFNQPVITNPAEVTMINPLGVHEEASDYGIHIHPNPSSGLINISLRLNEAHTFSWELTDATGRLILKKEPMWKSGLISEQIDLSKLDAGMYLLRLTVNNQTRACRIALKK